MRRRTSLTATFALVSLIAMAALGVVLTLSVAELLRKQALDNAVRTATMGSSGRLSEPPGTAAARILEGLWRAASGMARVEQQTAPCGVFWRRS